MQRLTLVLFWACLSAVVWAQPKEIVLPAGQSHSQTFDLRPRAGKAVHLRLRARVQFASPAGFSSPLVVTLNGTVLKGPQLVNKPPEFRMSNGSDLSWCFGQTWRVPYSPNYQSPVDWTPVSSSRPLANNEAYRFLFDVTPQARQGRNELQLRHEGPPGYQLHVEDVWMGEALNDSTAVQKTAPTVGSASKVYLAQASPTHAYRLLAGPEGCRLEIGAARFDIAANSASLDRLSPVAPGQSQTFELESPSSAYRIRRTVKPLGNRVSVVDEVENLTDQLLAVPLENRLHFGSQRPKARYATGRLLENGSLNNPANPSAVAEFSDFALGLVEEDDILRVQSDNFVDGQSLGFRDHHFGLGPHAHHRLEWSIYISGGDYWDLVNSVRRDWGVNEKLDGPLAIDPALMQPRRLSSAHYLVTGGTMQGNEVFEGPERCRMPWWLEKLKKWVTAVQGSSKTLVYLHWQICSEADVNSRYPGCRLLGPNGEQRTYPFDVPRPLCWTTSQNAYGKALLDAAPAMLRNTGASGFFLDEVNYSVFRFAYDCVWDGCSVEMVGGRPRAVSSVTLLGQSWKTELLARIRREGKVLVGNGAPHTRTIARMKFPTVNETISYATLCDAHFSTPWGLGNHDLTNDPGSWAEMTRRMLDYGCLFTPYQLTDKLPNCVFLGAMYPITIEELRPGVVLGKERIITNRSGQFGWADGGAARVLIFERSGLLDSKTEAKEVRQGSRRLYQITLPPHGLAILVRR